MDQKPQPQLRPPRYHALPGVWESVYDYPSSSRQAVFENKHLVQLHETDNYLIAESLSGSKSYVLIRLSVQGHVATGSWHEYTDANGYYKGAVYHGAIQLLISDDGKHMTGKWVGFGKDMEVNVGNWKLDYLGEEPPSDQLVL